MNTGRWKVPATRFEGGAENELQVNDLVNMYTRPGQRGLPPRAVLAEVAASINDPETGEPQSLATWAAKNSGILAAGLTASHYGDSHQKVTRLKLGNLALPAIAGGASLGLGRLLLTLPAGVCLIHGCHMDVSIQQTDGNIDADTPEVGIGTTIASGAVAILSGTPAFENIITGQVAADCDGTKTDKSLIPTAGAPLIIEAGGDHTVYFNVADAWAASGDTGALLNGDVWLNWTFLGA